MMRERGTLESGASLRHVGIRDREPGGLPLLCPECVAPAPTLEDLGVHLERHREILLAAVDKNGRPISTPCPRGCGRALPLRNAAGKIRKDWRPHLASCDGSPPLARLAPTNGQAERKGDAMADQTAEPGRFQCKAPTCLARFQSPKALGDHYEIYPDHGPRAAIAGPAGLG